MADYDNVYDPTVPDSLSGMSVLPEQRALLARLMESGQRQAATAQPEGYKVGGTYIAASPLEHLAAALQQGMGVARERGAEKAYQQSIGQERSALADAMRRYGALTQPQAAAAGPYTGE